jgi:hypothetical protein
VESRKNKRITRRSKAIPPCLRSIQGSLAHLDGSVSKGVSIYTLNTHPYENLNLYSIVSIEPAWVLHHK